MDLTARQQKGLQIAASARIKKAGAVWIVPSQTHSGSYVVSCEGAQATCSCPDHETRTIKCKHIFAVEISRTQVDANGQPTAVQTLRVTYTQDWPAYNRAQCTERETVERLLKNLCDGIQTPAHPGRGPKPIPLSDAIYGMTMKVYTTMSGRRASTDIRRCASAGHITRSPHYNSLFNYFDKPGVTGVLTSLIEQSAAPLASVENSFAVDSTGFGTVVYRRWYDQKYGREMKEHTWLKAHAMIGVVTNVVTAVNVTESNTNDSPELPALVAATKQRFAISEVSADKAYLSHGNLAAVEAAGAVPYVPFKSNSKGEGSDAWRRMWGLFMYRRNEFLAAYHKRSNVESAFSAIKRKFGPAVRSKNFNAQVNEVLCKVLCHNLSCLVHATHELGIEAPFQTVAS